MIDLWKSFDNHLDFPRLTNWEAYLDRIEYAADGVRFDIVLPGQKKEDISVKASDNNIEIQAKGVRKRYAIEDNLDTDKATATYEAGILKIHIPKHANSLPKCIPVTGE